MLFWTRVYSIYYKVQELVLTMKISSTNLVWLDLEMTGLNPDEDKILEIATIVTDKHLNVLAEGPVIAIHNSDAVLDKMDDWNKKTHGNSGLIERVKASKISVAHAEQMTLEFIQQYVPKSKSPLCGNSICQDRRFLFRYMPEFEAYLHYRNLDVSTIKILGRQWYPKLVKSFKKKTKHQALSDIYDSIDELKFYRENIFLKHNE